MEKIKCSFSIVSLVGIIGFGILLAMKSDNLVLWGFDLVLLFGSVFFNLFYGAKRPMLLNILLITAGLIGVLCFVLES